MALRGRVASILALVLALALALTVVGCGSTAEPAAEPTAEPAPEAAAPADSGGQALVEQKCTLCHPIDQVNAAIYDQAGWEETVARMEANGLVVTPEEKQGIIDYLVERDASR